MNLETLIALPRNIKKICFLIHDFLMIFIAFWFTQSLKADYSDEWFDFANWQSFLLTALLTITLFIRMGLYRAVTRFVSFHPDHRLCRQPRLRRIVLPQHIDF